MRLLKSLVEPALLVGEYLGLSRTVAFDSVGAVGKGDSDTSQDESDDWKEAMIFVRVVQCFGLIR